MILPLIDSRFGVTVKKFIHTEKQQVKGLGDTNFAVGMRHVKMYIKETSSDVANGIQLIAALSYCSVLASTTVEITSP